MIGRITKEWARFAGYLEQFGLDVRVYPSSTNIHHGVFRVSGLAGTPYEGGIFFIEVTLPETYPRVPPFMRALTPIGHPYVHRESGAINYDQVFNGPACGSWSPSFQMITYLGRFIDCMKTVPPENVDETLSLVQEYATQYYHENEAVFEVLMANSDFSEMSNRTMASYLGAWRFHPIVRENIPDEFHAAIGII